MGEVERVAFDLAYFWKINPLDLLERPLSDLFSLAEHMARITDTINAARK